MSSAATLPNLPDAFTHPGNMPSPHQFFAALASDPIATAGAFLLVVLVVAYLLVIAVFARRSGNDMHHKSLIPVRSDEQRAYWITRRRQRFVAVHGDYPDLFGNGTLLGEATKHRKLHTAKAKLDGSRKHINVNPAKRREPYLPVFAPKMSGDDLLGEIDRLEAQSEPSPTPKMTRLASEERLGWASGPWWKMFDRERPGLTKAESRTGRTPRPKSRSSLGTMASLLEAVDENDGEQVAHGYASPAQQTSDSSEMAISRAGSEGSFSVLDGERAEYEMQPLAPEPPMLSPEKPNNTRERFAVVQEHCFPEVRPEEQVHKEPWTRMPSSSSAESDNDENAHASMPKTLPALKPEADNSFGSPLPAPTTTPSGRDDTLADGEESDLLLEDPPGLNHRFRTAVVPQQRKYKRPSTLGLEYD